MKFSWETNIPSDIKEEELVFCSSCKLLFDSNKYPPTKKGLIGNKGYSFKCPRCEKSVLDVTEVTGTEE